MKDNPKKQYYEDLYDLFTIKECLRGVELWKKIYQKSKTAKEIKKVPKEESARACNFMYNIHMLVTKTQRYKDRAATIQGWIDRDKARQDKLDNTPAPKNIICPNCQTKMVTDDFKILEDWDKGDEVRVLFTFNCPKCKKREGIYDNGDKHISKPALCPKCHKEIKTTLKLKNRVLTTTTECSSCGYKNIDIDDWDKEDVCRKAEKKADQELLDKYRREFCLSDKEGQENIEMMEAMDVAHEVRLETMAEYDNPVYERKMQLKKTSVTDLEKILSKKMEETNFSKLSFASPEIDRYVIVPFTVQNTDVKRKDRESEYQLKKLINQNIKDTNWRLESNEISYRLGYLSGRLKGYESEEDLLKLAGKEETKKPKSKIDPEKRRKYESHSYVQLARLFGEIDAKSNIRKRRLKNEPEGFFLDDEEGGGYTCGICGGSHEGKDIWWQEDGLRCRDCWNNIKKGVIPMFKLDAEDWEKEFLTRSDITYKYKIHPATIGKMRRHGELVGRDLRNKDEWIYCEVFLVKENKKFFIKDKNKYLVT